MGEALPTEAGEVVRQGRGRWVQSVRLGWDQLTGVQLWLCEQALGVEPAPEEEKPKPRRTQADKWTANLAAARQFFEREGDLKVPRKHVETVLSEDGREDQYRLGVWVNNQRSRDAVAGAGGAAVQSRDAVVVMGVVVIAAGYLLGRLRP
ncbi:helicase associated domain-containing protein [Streptomyces sp. NPDC056210]|uniref:helicase associated domain-containing protein n=1 Tax=Streptomyces sp. NPDC056210 TaxID=3345746 RepID=UPI0035DC2815